MRMCMATGAESRKCCLLDVDPESAQSGLLQHKSNTNTNAQIAYSLDCRLNINVVGDCIVTNT